MPDPTSTETLTVVERIAQNVLAVCQTINASTGSAYTLTIQRRVFESSPRHLYGELFQGTPDKLEDDVTFLDCWHQPFALVMYVIPGPADPTPIDTYNNAIYGDLYKALMLDYTRGNLAQNTIIEPPLNFPPINGEYAGMTFALTVHYRTAKDDPFTPAIAE